MDIANSHERLSSLWGLIDRQHNQLVESQLAAQSGVLDIGCGFGSLVNFLSQKGHDAEGIDLDKASIDVALKLFPTANVHLVDAEELSRYAAESFDAVVLKDALHHIVHENDTERIFENVRRILKADGRLIVVDPNPMWIVRLARFIVRHEDPEVSPGDALVVLEKEGFTIKDRQFYEVVGLPLSGGYVGVRFVPNLKILNNMAATTNHLLSTLFNRIGLGRYLCWRYIIRAELTSAPK